MSNYTVEEGELKFVFGWDQQLMSFFLQVHDLSVELEENVIVMWLGATQATMMYEVEDLVRAAGNVNLLITPELEVQLYGDKDGGL